MWRSSLIGIVVAVLCAAALRPAALRGADDEKMDKDKVKAKEAEKTKEKDKEEKDENWTGLLTVSNAAGGFKHFSVEKNSRVKFTWETTPDGQVPQFRVTVAKLNDRNGNYQTLGTVTSVFRASKDSATMNLGPGKYRLYIATKSMKYTLTVEGKEK